MITLVVGTNNSGKSMLAEKLVMETSERSNRYYIATMIPFGDEGIERIKKHRKMREGKGFITCEWPVDIDKHLCELEEETLRHLAGSTILLECMSNLVGNELYSTDNKGCNDDFLTEKIISEVNALTEAAANVIIVTNVFPREDEGYDDETIRYVNLTERVNARLRKLSHKVYELRDGEWIGNENN